MKLLFENWREYIGEAASDLKDKRVMYHIGRRPASPKPAERWGEKGGWTRKWMDEPVPSGVFLTPNPVDVVQHHGVSGNVYIYKVPEWVIKKAGGKHRYDSAGELLISQEIWDEAGDEIEFLGKTMDQNDLWDSVEPSYFGDRDSRNKKKRPYEAAVSGIAGHRNAEDIIKMLTSQEKQQLMSQLEDMYPEALKGEPFEVEWEKAPGERKGYRKDFRLGEPRISKNHQELLDLLKKYIDIDKSPPKMFENWRKYLVKAKGLEELKHISAKPWGSTEAKHEWGEEIKTSLDNGDEYIGQRWPDLNKQVIEEKYPFMLSAEDFAEVLSKAPIKNLSLSQMKDIHNHAQVYDIIEMYEKNKSSEEVEKEMFEFFKGHTTDPNIAGKTFPKESSYRRWVDEFAKSDVSGKPPIVLELPNGKLAHIGGQTRQTGALTNKKIIPYAVISPVQGEDFETPI